MKAGPLKSAFETSTKGVLYQELITYRINLNGMLTKESVTRTFKHDGNYHDTSHYQPLIKINDNETS